MKLNWKKDAFGRPTRILMLGNAYIGGVDKHHPRSKTVAQDIMNGANNGHTTVTRPWRGWFMNDRNGVCTGWYKTEEEAKEAVEATFKPEAIV